jgi:hypothetical protein
MPATQSLLTHEVSAVSYDRAGNSGLAYRGEPQARDYEYFGYGDNFELGPHFQDAVDGNAQVIRFPIPWCNNQSSRTSFEWAQADRVYDDVVAYNQANSTTPIYTLPVLFSAPAWARGGTGDSCGGPPSNDTQGMADWTAFVSAFVARYGPGGTYAGDYGHILAIEAWNEPNLLRFWEGATQETAPFDAGFFAKLVNRAAQASGVPVLAGGPATAEAVYDSDRPDDDPAQFLHDATNPNAVNHIDPSEIAGIALHLYANKKANTRRANNQIDNRYDDIVGQLSPGFPSKDRWITEIGFPSHGNKSLGYATPVKQRQRLVHSFHAFSADPYVRTFIVHRMRDISDENGDFGVIHEGGTRKWVYCWFWQRLAATGDPAQRAAAALREATGVGGPTCQPKD